MTTSFIFPRMYLSGLEFSVAGGSPNFSVAAGQAADSNNLTILNFGSGLTKTAGAFAAGTGNGALDIGSVTSNTWYWVFLITQADGVTNDICITKAVAGGPAVPTLPAGFTLFRYIGSLLTDGSNNWVKVIQNGDQFLWDANYTDLTGGAATTIQTLALHTPLGVNTQAILQLLARLDSPDYDSRGWIFSPDTNSAGVLPASAASLNFGATAITGSNGMYWSGSINLKTDKSSQIKWVLFKSSAQLWVSTNGYIDRRGQDS